MNFWQLFEGKTRMKFFLRVLVVIVPAAACSQVGGAEPIDVGSRLEMFVDEYLIDHLNGAELRLHKPRPREVVITHDAPWEGSTSYYHVVFQDGSLYRMYYRGSEWDEEADDQLHYAACYAESRDGIHWTKPELGLHEFNGSKQNNIIFTGRGRQNFAPLKDANPGCSPDARYKAFAGVGGDGGIWTFKSPDGIHWSPLSDGPVITQGAFDSGNLTFWDTSRNRYVDFHRGFRNDYRDVLTCTSTDFQNWTEPVFLEYPDAPPEHLYTNAIVPYYRAPHIFIGFPKRFLPSRNPTGHFKTGTSDVLLMSSRDGRTFRRWAEPVIPEDAPEDRAGNRSNYMAWGLLPTPGNDREYSVYASENYLSRTPTRLRRFTYRLDGFVALRGGEQGGQLTTKPMKVAGGQLEVNYLARPGGYVRAEIQDAEGQPLAGFAAEDCEPLKGDQIARVVSWRGDKQGPFTQNPVRVRFDVKDADVYAFRFK